VKLNYLKLALSALLASVFILALGYSVIIGPLLLHRGLKSLFPDLFYTKEPWLMMAEYTAKVRWIGYASFIAVTLLFVLGVVTGRKSLVKVGTGAFFLPTFASFVYTMFFMAGLGFLRILWLPLLDVNPLILRLGDGVLLPLIPVIILLFFVGTSLDPIWITFILVGLSIFFFGIVTWLYGKMEGRTIIDFWVYRYSRHPQYLGFLIFTYGLMIRALYGGIYFEGSLTFPSLPWLISALVVVCVALWEELEMLESGDEAFRSYRDRTPFMLPLPAFISGILTAPIRRVSSRSFPMNKRHVAYIFVTYFIVLCLLSIVFWFIFPLA